MGGQGYDILSFTGYNPLERQVAIIYTSMN